MRVESRESRVESRESRVDSRESRVESRESRVESLELRARKLENSPNQRSAEFLSRKWAIKSLFMGLGSPGLHSGIALGVVRALHVEIVRSGKGFRGQGLEKPPDMESFPPRAEFKPK